MDQTDLATWTGFFMWASILNLGLMTLTTFAWMGFRSQAHRIHGRIFGVSSATVDITAYASIAVWKALTIAFFICPWLALLILA